MVRTIFIISFLISFFAVKADHLLGADITYSHVSNMKYEIFVTLYRDCSSCKLGGQGGGSSNSTCSDISFAYIRTISSTCGNSNIGSGVKLSKTGFENITAICNPTNSTCGSNPTYSFGIEAHHYKGTIDFDNYKSYSNCEFNIFISAQNRASTSFSSSSEKEALYNYVMINPWKEQISSPKFKHHPKITFNVNQSAYFGDYTTHDNGDSIVYKWASPLKNNNTPLNYTGAYSKTNFISTYCPSGETCSANPTTNPPQGLYLNSETGNCVFTPISQNQKSTRVLEVQQWRKHEGAFYLASKIRRDVIIIITAENQNKTPKIIADEQYNLCVGQPFNIGITATDGLVSGSTIYDSVNLSVDYSLSSLTVTTTNINTAPYQKLTLSMNPSQSDVGIHYLKIKARDNHCPEYGESSKIIRLKISPKPSIDFTLDDEFCGNNRINISADRNATFSLDILKNSQSIDYISPIINGNYYRNFKKEALTYSLYYQDELGCIDSLSKSISNIGNTDIPRATIYGQDTVCKGSPLKNYLSHPSLFINSSTWEMADNPPIETDTITEIAKSGILNVRYLLTENGLDCYIKDSIKISTIDVPTLTIDAPKSLCFKDIVSLDILSAQPLGGEWKWPYGTIENNFLDLKTTIPNEDTSIELTYQILDNNTSCTVSESINIVILAAPKMEIADQRICGTLYPYRLTNTIKLPYFHSVENITWRVANKPTSYIASPYPIIDIPNYGIGTYEIEATNTYKNGCIAKDSSTITVTKDLKLTTNGKTTICQSTNSIDLNELFNINAKGGGWHIENGINDLREHLLIPKHCGPIKMEYTYDLNGCYDKINFNAKIVCKPSFDISLSDSICSNYGNINLPSAFIWSGIGISNSTLNPQTLNIGKNNVTGSVKKEGCVFDTTISINVLPPISLKTVSNQTNLCEGENLDIDLISPQFARLSVQSCDKVMNLDQQKKYSYSPTQCDLDSKSINLAFTATSTALCSNVISNISIPYYEAPEITAPILQDGCAPYHLDVTIATDPGTITYNLSSKYDQFYGNSRNLLHQDLSAGSYSLQVSVEDLNGCKNSKNFNSIFNVWPKPQADFTMLNTKTMTLSKRELILNNYSNLEKGELYSQWFLKKEDTPIFFSNHNNPVYKLPADTGHFQIILVAKSDKQCSDTARHSIILVPDIIAFIPNAFTPDNKGPEINSKFRVISDHAQYYNIEIFNKWGQKVYSSRSIQEAWDGTYIGKFCQSGVYIYVIDIINKAGKEYKFQGTVHLIR